LAILLVAIIATSGIETLEKLNGCPLLTNIGGFFKILGGLEALRVIGTTWYHPDVHEPSW
jgi:hypothetical protein